MTPDGTPRARTLARLLALALGLVLALGAALLLEERARRAAAAGAREASLADVLREPALREELIARMAAESAGEFDSHPDADLGHVHLKGTHARPFGALEINSYGVREREYALPKPPGSVRVVLLGDSFVFGWHVAAGERLGVHLERALNERQTGARVPVEVLHLAVTSWNLVGECAFVRRQLERLAPDLVVQVCLPNDLDDTTGARGFGGMGNFAPRFPAHADTVVRMLSPQEEFGFPISNLLWTGLGFESAQRFDEARRAVLGLAAELAALPQPASYVLFANWGEAGSALRAQLGTALETGQQAYLPERFRADESLRLPDGDPHWNARGHERVARVLYGLVRERALLPRLTLAAWPEAENDARALLDQGWQEAQGYEALTSGLLSALAPAIEARAVTAESARQILIGLDRERLVSPYASFVLGQPAPARALRVRGRGLAEHALRGARVRVSVEEFEVGSFELQPGQPLDFSAALPPETRARRALGVRLEADDYVYRGAALRHCVSFELERLALE